MKKHKIKLIYDKNHHIEQNKQYKNNITKDKNQINHNTHNVVQLSTSVLDFLKVFITQEVTRNPLNTACIY